MFATFRRDDNRNRLDTIPRRVEAQKEQAEAGKEPAVELRAREGVRCLVRSSSREIRDVQDPLVSCPVRNKTKGRADKVSVVRRCSPNAAGHTSGKISGTL